MVLKKLDVYFKPGVHPQFREIYKCPPSGVRYTVSLPRGDHNSSVMRSKRNWISRFQKVFQVPRMMYVKNSSNYDLIHSTRGISVLNRVPWIVDIESGAAFSGLDWVSLKKPIMQWSIKKFLSSKYCKKILPQSLAASRSLTDNLDCSAFKDKIEVLYLAYRSHKLRRRDSDVVRLSFIGRGFFVKGCHDLQEAFKILNKKYDVSLKIKSIVPDDWKLNLPNVKYVTGNLSPEELYNTMFGDCDIYVQPTMVDSYGVTILEAMSTGLPVVCTDDFTFPELIEEGYNGFTVKTPVSWYDYRLGRYDQFGVDVAKIHKPMVKELVEKISLLIEDSKLRKTMGRNSFNLVDKGKFSIKERNKKLRRIYDEALS